MQICKDHPICRVLCAGSSRTASQRGHSLSAEENSASKAQPRRVWAFDVGMQGVLGAGVQLAIREVERLPRLFYETNAQQRLCICLPKLSRVAACRLRMPQEGSKHLATPRPSASAPRRRSQSPVFHSRAAPRTRQVLAPTAPAPASQGVRSQ